MSANPQNVEPRNVGALLVRQSASDKREEGAGVGRIHRVTTASNKACGFGPRTRMALKSAATPESPRASNTHLERLDSREIAYIRKLKFL
jgi:hypothetical protein